MGQNGSTFGLNSITWVKMSEIGLSHFFGPTGPTGFIFEATGFWSQLPHAILGQLDYFWGNWILKLWFWGNWIFFLYKGQNKIQMYQNSFFEFIQLPPEATGFWETFGANLGTTGFLKSGSSCLQKRVWGNWIFGSVASRGNWLKWKKRLDSVRLFRLILHFPNMRCTNYTFDSKIGLVDQVVAIRREPQ